MRKRGKVALGVLGGVLAVVLVLLALLYASVSGGWDDAFRPKKTASSDDVRDARKGADGTLAREVAALRLPSGEPRESCQRGQHNWKIDDDYDVSCQLRLKAEQATGTRREQTAWLRALHDRLIDKGWKVETAGNRLDESVAEGGTTGYYSRGPEWSLFLKWSSAAVHVELAYRFYEG